MSALLLFWIRRREPTPAPTTETPGIRREIIEGLKLVFGSPVLRSIGVSKAAMGLAGGIIGTLIVLYGIDTLGFEPGVLGTIFAVGGVSSILGALNVGRFTRRFGLGRTLVVGFLIYGISGFLIPLARGPLLVAGAILTVAQLFDFSMIAYEVNEMSLRQSATPQRLLGRVNASMEVTMLSFQLLGALLAGALAETVGMRWALFIGSSFMVFGGMWMLLSPVWRMSAVPEVDIG